MSREDTPGVQRAIGEATPLKLPIGRAVGIVTSIVVATATATAFAFNLQFGVSDLKRASEVQAKAAEAQAIELRELRASVVELREWARRFDRRFDRGGDVSAVAPNSYPSIP